jgi:regulator of sirC expression with transglutaminase-like and TPR domain
VGILSQRLRENNGDVHSELMTLVRLYRDELPLDRAASLIAAEEGSDLDPEALVRDLDRLAEGLHIPATASSFEAVARLNHHLFEVHGFQGDTSEFDSPENSLLNHVLARKKGLPVLLSLIAIEVGRRAGFELLPIPFPTHFLVAPANADPRFYIDPFHRGEIHRPGYLRARLNRILGQAIDHDLWLDAIAPASNSSLLFRMCNNLKAAYLRRGNIEGALRAVEHLLVIDPCAYEELRDRGALQTQLGHTVAGIADFEAYISARPYAPDADDVARFLATLKP